MILRRTHKTARRGVTAVEMAVVSVMFFTLLFGIFEYCRFLVVLHVTNNAARDAARYAVVKTNGGNMPGDPSAVATQEQMKDLVQFGTLNGSPLTAGMAGLEKNIENLQVTVFTVDPAGLNQAPPVIRPLTSGNGANVPWNNAAFGQKIAVRIAGDYHPIAAGLLFLPDLIPFQVTVMVASEAN